MYDYWVISNHIFSPYEYGEKKVPPKVQIPEEKNYLIISPLCTYGICLKMNLYIIYGIK